MVERTQQAAFAVHFQVAGSPYRRCADVAGENGVVVGVLADLLRQILRVDRLIVIGGRQSIEILACSAVVLQRLVKKRAVALRLQLRQQGGEGGVDIAHQRHIDRAVRTDAAGVDVDLNDVGVGRVERAVGELGAEQ
ncbi:hypothetical protein D3C79_930960 [compost metagenome]